MATKKQPNKFNKPHTLNKNEFINGASTRSDCETDEPSKKYKPKAPQKVPFNLRMDLDLREVMEKIAAKEERSLHWIANKILTVGLRQKAKEHKIPTNF